MPVIVEVIAIYYKSSCVQSIHAGPNIVECAGLCTFPIKRMLLINLHVTVHIHRVLAASAVCADLVIDRLPIERLHMVFMYYTDQVTYRSSENDSHCYNAVHGGRPKKNCRYPKIAVHRDPGPQRRYIPSAPPRARAVKHLECNVHLCIT